MLPADEPPLSAQLIRSRYEALLRRLRAAALAAGRDPDGFRVVAVTKGFGTQVVQIAREAGLARFGENRVQEALPKVAAVPAAEWHLVGHLQDNKVRRAVRAFTWIHSVDDLGLLQRIEEIAHQEGRRPSLLLEVNVTSERARSGFDLAAFAAAVEDPRSALANALRAPHRARVSGLMSIGPFGEGDDASRAAFALTRALRDRLQETAGVALPELSMGMTADAELAVAEGASIVRVGTALFGPRPHPAGRAAGATLAGR